MKRCQTVAWQWSGIQVEQTSKTMHDQHDPNLVTKVELHFFTGQPFLLRVEHC